MHASNSSVIDSYPRGVVPLNNNCGKIKVAFCKNPYLSQRHKPMLKLKPKLGPLMFISMFKQFVRGESNIKIFFRRWHKKFSIRKIIQEQPTTQRMGVACVSVQKNELNWIIWFDWIVPFKLSKNHTIYMYQVIIRRLFSCPLLCTRGRSGSIFQTPSTINLICTTGKFVFVFMRMMRKIHQVINWPLPRICQDTTLGTRKRCPSLNFPSFSAW